MLVEFGDSCLTHDVCSVAAARVGRVKGRLPLVVGIGEVWEGLTTSSCRWQLAALNLLLAGTRQGRERFLPAMRLLVVSYHGLR